ncbi:MAG: DUF2764 family protein [Bacteroidales bacterium]|nr:DUF2764 family protein [Bacteroidales bacterium]
MNNYEYIIASLPVPGKDAGKLDAEALLTEIRSQCSESDNALIDMLLGSFEANRLDSDFYSSAWHSHNGFLRDYLLFDLKVRNAKVEYLNSALKRPEGQDLMPIPDGADASFDEKSEVDTVLAGKDILARERGLDDIMWAKADELVQMHIFDVDIILAFIAKLKIADRWNKLDPESGREMFRRLVQEIRNTR